MKLKHIAEIRLRALEPEDLTFLYIIENNIDNWSISDTKIPFSKYILHEYLKNIEDDITKTGQLRLVIENTINKEPIGLIDLFNYDAINQRSEVGIIIEEEFREKGYGNIALEILKNYCKKTLNIHQLYCEIHEDNIKSVSFFKKNDFEKTGIKKDWHLVETKYINVLFFQCFL